MLIRMLQPDFIYSDARGNLTQLCRSGYTQINVVTSIGGSFRGGHYHKKCSEAFFVVKGSFDLLVSKDDLKEKYTFRENDMFLVPPFIVHSFDFINDTVLVAMYDTGVELSDGTKDIFQVENKVKEGAS